MSEPPKSQTPSPDPPKPPPSWSRPSGSRFWTAVWIGGALFIGGTLLRWLIVAIQLIRESLE